MSEKPVAPTLPHRPPLKEPQPMVQPIGNPDFERPPEPEPDPSPYTPQPNPHA